MMLDSGILGQECGKKRKVNNDQVAYARSIRSAGPRTMIRRPVSMNKANGPRMTHISAWSYEYSIVEISSLMTNSRRRDIVTTQDDQIRMPMMFPLFVLLCPSYPG